MVPFNPAAIIATDKDDSPQDPPKVPPSNDGQENDNSVSNLKDVSCSEEKMLTFVARLEEGYELYDPEYAEWLQLYHPETLCAYFASISFPSPLQYAASSVQVQKPWPLMSTPSIQSQFLPESASSQPQLSSDVPTTPLSCPLQQPLLDPATPTSSHLHQPLATPPSIPSLNLQQFHLAPTSDPWTPEPLASNLQQSPQAPGPTTSQSLETPPNCSLDIQQQSPPIDSLNQSLPVPSNPSSQPLLLTPSSMEPQQSLPNPKRTLASAPHSMLQKHLEPLSILQSNIKKTGTARVLTSNECLSMLEEKKRKKKELEEEKEKRKKERERKKKEREEMMKKKKDEREQRQREKKATGLRQKQTAKKNTRSKKPSSLTASASNSSEPASLELACVSASTSNASEPSKSESRRKPGIIEDVSVNESAVCFGVYCNDGEEWIQCARDRWVHEDCVEELFTDSSGRERFCPVCTSLCS